MLLKNFTTKLLAPFEQDARFYYLFSIYFFAGHYISKSKSVVMSKKQQSHSIFTNIEDYVRAKYPDFASLFDYCKLFPMTLPRGGSAGVTLIIPSNKVIESIRDAAFSSSAEEVGKGCDMILSHLMRKAVKTPREWLADDISDMRYPSQQITAKVSGSNVELQARGATYATIKQDPDFKLGFRSNIAVWLLTDGHMRSETDLPAKPRVRQRGQGRGSAKGVRAGGDVSGGYDLAQAHADSDRFKIAILAENEFVLQHMDPSKAKDVCPFLNYVMSFAHFMHDHHIEEFIQCVLPLIHFRATDFYFLFEPHRVVAPDMFLVPSEYISEWWSSFQYQSQVQMDPMAFRAWIDTCLAEAPSHDQSAIYTNPTALVKAIDEIRTSLTPAIVSAAGAVRAIHGVYQTFVSKNEAGEIANVFPQRLIAYYQTNHLYKLMHDELSFVIEPLMIRVCKAFDVQRFRDIIKIIGNAMHANTQQEVERMLPLLSPDKLTSGIATEGLLAEITVFVNSTMFLWIPLSTAMIKNYEIQHTPTRTDNPEVIYNADLALALHHERIYGDKAGRIADANKELALAALRNIDKAHLSPELQAKLTALSQ